MRDPKGSRAKGVRVVFTSTISIEKAALDRAIAGGIASTGAGRRFTPEQREDAVQDVYARLQAHFAKGGVLETDLRSFAFATARNAVIRPDAYTRRRVAVKDAAAIEPDEAHVAPLENPEGRCIRRSEAEKVRRVLTAALGRVSREDRETLIAMLARSEPMPRTTPTEVRLANATAQREKRARDRLVRAGREALRGREAGPR